jgi:hypothetical protein
MDTMQQELQDNYPLLRIQLVGLNEKGQEPGNPSTTEGRTLPWLQDGDTNADGKSDVFTSWQVALRDVVILDGDNAKVGVYNLNTHNLAVEANYNTLREMFVDAAMVSQLPWKNAIRPLDVDNNGVIAPLDALIVINRLNAQGAGPLPPPVASQSPPPFYDPSGDNQVTALDALQVINHLNGAGSLAAGEGESLVPTAWAAIEGREWLSIGSETSRFAKSWIGPTAQLMGAPRPGQAPELTAIPSWQTGVDLAFATDARSAPPKLQRPAFVPERSELGELDAWWFSQRDAL